MSVNNDEKDTTTQVKMVDATTSANVGPGTELIPGTELMEDSEQLHFKRGKGDVVLIPQPSSDPNDPLNWSRPWKLAVAANMLAYTYFSCWASLGIGSFSPILASEFDVSLQKVSYLTGCLILTLGIANLVVVPYASNYGRRPAFFWSNVICFVACIWQAVAKNYGSFMAARILDGFGAAANESLGPVVVADMFFLHERGFWNGCYFFVLFCSSGMGSIFGGYIASSYLGWRWFFWLCTIIQGVLCITTFLFFPETKYQRAPIEPPPSPSSSGDQKLQESKAQAEEIQHVEAGPAPVNLLHQGYPSMSQKYSMFPRKDPRTSNMIAILLPLSLLRYPIIVFASFSLAWGATCLLQLNLLEGQVFGYAPYNWDSAEIGNTGWALAVGALIGMATAGPFSDWVSSRSTRKNNGVREAEMRLPALIPFVVILIVGSTIAITGFAKSWDWKPIVIVGFGFIGIEMVAIPTITITYAVDCYKPVAGEILTIGTIVKNTWSFGVTFYLNDWAAKDGYEVMWFTPAVLMTILCFSLPLYFFGKKVRGWSKNDKVHFHNL